MPSDPLGGPIWVILLLLLAYAWLSAAQAAVRGLNEARLRRDAEESDGDASLLLPIAEQAEDARTALKICATFCGVLCGAVSAVWLAPPVAAWLTVFSDGAASASAIFVLTPVA